MNISKFKLNLKNNEPFLIEIHADKKETHALIRITKGAFCDSLNLIVSNKEGDKHKNLPAESLLLLNVSNYQELTLNANFSSQKGFIDAEIHTGNWQEMLLAEIECSFSDAPYCISCNQDQLEFTIGLEKESRLEITPAEAGFNVNTTIVNPPNEDAVAAYYIADGSDASQIIRRLYGRIKGRVKGAGFEARQEEYKAKLIDNFNRTMVESISPVQ